MVNVKLTWLVKSLVWEIDQDGQEDTEREAGKAVVYFTIIFWEFFFFLLNFCSFGEGNCNPLQYSCLENPMDRGAW